MNITGFFDSAHRDLRYVLRGLLRRPAFSLTAVLTLALGIGATTAIFSVVYTVLIKPLPYPESGELLSLQHVAPGLNSEALPMSQAMYFTYLDENQTFEQIGLWNDGGASVVGIGDPEQARVRWVTYGVLQALGVQPTLGRWFSAADDTPGADGPDPVILTYGYWQLKFGGDPAVIGRSMSIDSRPAQVIGVMPAGFRFLNMVPEAELILAMRPDRSQTVLGGFGLQGLGRLAPGVTLAQAQADIERILPIWLDAWPATPGGLGREEITNWQIAPALVPLKDSVVGDIASILWVLMAAIGSVLLIACANVASLMLVRADARRQEFAVRATLGAGRARIAKALFVESAVLGAFGGVVGLALAFVGLKFLATLEPSSLPRLQEISVDPLVLGFVIVASLASSLLFGSIPALKHASQATGPLGVAARGATASRERHTTRSALIVAQVALALVLIVCSGLMIRTFLELRDVDPGFTRPEEVQIARIALTPFIASGAERYTQIQRQILDQIEMTPGVESASFAYGAPMEAGRTPPSLLYAEDQSYVAGETPPMRRFQIVAPGYFETVGTRLITGRDISWPDIDSGGRVAVISESLARELWGEPNNAIGKRIRESAPDAPGVWREIAGVVQDVHEDGVDQDAPRLVYWPVMMENFGGQATLSMPFIAYVIRSERAGTASFVTEVRQAVWSVNADLPVFLVSTLQDLYAESLARTSFTLVMLAIAAVMALGLGTVGICGAMAYIVSQRTPEIGIRLALGAQPGALKRMFVLQSLMPVAVGLVGGLAAAVVLTRLMESLLFGVSTSDTTTYVGALGVLVVAAALASDLPARRAASIDPIETLKVE